MSVTISYKYILYTLIYLITSNWKRKNAQSQPVDEYMTTSNVSLSVNLPYFISSIRHGHFMTLHDEAGL